MSSDERIDAVLDHVLERALRGETSDVESLLEGHPDLSPADGERLRVLARALSLGTDRVRAVHLPAESGLPCERLGDFRLLRRLGEGGTGIVFLAEQESLGRLVALKVLRPERLGSKDAEARLERESRAIGRLRHPNIVAVLAAGVGNGIRYFAMDLVPGKALDEVLQEWRTAGARPAIPTVLRWIADLARALHAAHGAGIVHRDVKPSNVRVTPDGRALLVDFGLAQDVESATLTTTGSFRGTPHYASPEQVAAKRTGIDALTDVYSLGVVLYECVGGRVPFDGETTEQVFNQILVKDPVPPRRLNPSISRDLETIIETAMEKDRERRYSSAAALAEDLEALLACRMIRARPAGPARRALKWIRRNRAASLATAVVILTLAGSSAMLAAREAAAARRVGDILAEADVAEANGEFASALLAIGRARAIRPDDAGAIRREAELSRRKREIDAERTLDDARRRLEVYRNLSARVLEARSRLDSLRYSEMTVHFSREQQHALHRGELELRWLGRDLDEAFYSVEEALNQAERLDPENSSIPDVRSDLDIEKWREAVRTDDRNQASFWADRVRRSDAKRRYLDELDAKGTVSFLTNPEGARVYVFRMVEQIEIDKRGERRLVPVPLGDPELPVPPGTWALRVVKAAGALQENDVIFEVHGHPIEGTVLASQDHATVRRFDRLVSIDGSPIREDYDVEMLGGQGPMRPFEFERDGALFVEQAQSLWDLAVLPVEPDVLVERVPGVDVRAYHRGEVRSLEIPPGLKVRTTAAPLFPSPRCCLGATPIERCSLEPGSYLALIRHDGFEDVRYPFVVERSKESNARVELQPVGSTPLGLVFVAEGSFVAGGDPEAYRALPRSRVEVASFWMMDREVNGMEYQEFLDDPETRREIAQSDKPIRFPRYITTLESDGYCQRAPDGRYVIEPGRLRLPVHGISWDDAAAFARFWTRKARLCGVPFEFALPTCEEREKAARGADERRYPYGNRFSPLWMGTRKSREGPEYILEPPFRLPIDESPYGIFDLGGNVAEWLDGGQGQQSDEAPLSEGSASRCRPHEFLLAARGSVKREVVFGVVGFRLVARRVR